MRSRNHYCIEKAINITYSTFVFSALVMQPEMRLRRFFIVICGLLRSTKFFHIFS